MAANSAAAMPRVSLSGIFFAKPSPRTTTWQPLLGAAVAFPETMPSLAELNAAAAQRGLFTGNGQPLRFVLPDRLDIGYERRAFALGEVSTIGLCGKACFIPTDVAGLADLDHGTLSALDGELAHRLASADFPGPAFTRWQPLPLLGIPGVTAANEDPAWYDDTRQFRPRPSRQPTRN